eukprot:CAMPEP_0201567524 /NCGR_PEP_ID=MMETSP0190_2-20130828/8033_1 /ASSEMBLY_ACC=CAM_ASM_000263 /TAXON_ID=37353 /ORGANISM="Rosalina sp." /LENGTH=98 /DNA_ID=CAMNT_0047987595 /DNA_START=82 /DNA_END=375 /DNA_ORIENTATION=+
MRNICKPKPEDLGIVEEENDGDEMKQLEEPKMQLHRSTSLPLHLDNYGPLKLDKAMEIKKLPTGHWIQPQIDNPNDAIPRIDTKGVDAKTTDGDTANK